MLLGEVQNMSKLSLAVLLVFVFLCLGCGEDSTEKPEEPPVIQTLWEHLEYPKGLWIMGGKVYFTEASGRRGYGGKDALSVYDPIKNTKTLLRDTLICTEGVVVTNDTTVYLTSWLGNMQGDSGEVSLYNRDTRKEDHIADLDMASVDMFIDSGDTIYIIGSSVTPSVASMYRLSPGHYANPQVIHESLGKTRSLTKSGSILYYSEEGGGIKRFVGGTLELFVNKDVWSISVSSVYLFYADLPGGKIGKINISTKAEETIATGLHSPIAVRWVEAESKLYFLEAGTSVQQYKDGRLRAITGIH
jgi:hypothetical protein